MHGRPSTRFERVSGRLRFLQDLSASEQLHRLGFAQGFRHTPVSGRRRRRLVGGRLGSRTGFLVAGQDRIRDLSGLAVGQGLEALDERTVPCCRWRVPTPSPSPAVTDAREIPAALLRTTGTTRPSSWTSAASPRARLMASRSTLARSSSPTCHRTRT
jgi:hypothetical protein